jgi:hypothetical protein
MMDNFVIGGCFALRNGGSDFVAMVGFADGSRGATGLGQLDGGLVK